MIFKTIKEILRERNIEEKVKLNGWVRTKRVNGKITFIELYDGTNLKGIQIVFNEEKNTFESLKNIITGTSIYIEGTLILSPAKEQDLEVLGENAKIIGEAGPDYPLQKKRHSFEFLREIAHLRPRTNTFGAVTRVRSKLAFKIHEFFQKEGFFYINTPIITSNDGEGAGEIFKVSSLEREEIKAERDIKDDFFSKEAFLTVTGQLHGEAFALALSKIYTFGPTFRAENSNTSRHLAEFWMIEPEVAFYDLRANIKLAEDFLKYIVSQVLEECEEDLIFFNKWIEQGLIEKLENIVKKSFEVITYTEAISILKKANVNFDFEPIWGGDLQSEHEKYLSDEVFKGPITVIDYPKEIKAFYMKENLDGKTVKAMDILIPKIGEIIGGSQREEDFERLKMRMKELKIPTKDYEWYLELRKFGSVPHSGFGLGFERLIQYVTGMSNIRDVIAFPRTPKNLKF